MTYLDPNLQIPLMLDSNAEMYNSFRSDKVKMNDLVEVWLKVFQQQEKYDATHIVQCQRMLFESASVALREMTRTGFDVRQREKELNTELSYEDAAQYLDCSVSTIKRLVGQSKLKVKKYNSKVVKITMKELESFRGNLRDSVPTHPV